MSRAFLPMLWLVLSLASLQAVAAEPPPAILGVRLGMDARQARERLSQLGKLEREERKRQEVWKLEDPRYTHLLVGFDKQGHVRYVTAVTRSDGQRVAYKEVGDPRAAKRVEAPGHLMLTWEVGGKEARKGYVVMARGSGPKYLDTWSVKQLE